MSSASHFFESELSTDIICRTPNISTFLSQRRSEREKEPLQPSRDVLLLLQRSL